MNRSIIFGIIVFTTIFLVGIDRWLSPSQGAKNPKAVVWVWDKEEDLSSINATKYIIAPLLCTIQLQVSTIRIEPRHHRIIAPHAIETIGVIRIESPKHYQFQLTKDHILQIGMSISGLQRQYHLKEIQIDFDSVRSERLFYQDLLTYIRFILPSDTKISITALASWFAFDHWWRDLPVDEIVFMFYDLKEHEKRIYEKLLKKLSLYRAKQKISVGLCAKSLIKIENYHHRVFWWGNPESELLK
jgi:hypothetical protein